MGGGGGGGEFRFRLGGVLIFGPIYIPPVMGCRLDRFGRSDRQQISYVSL